MAADFHLINYCQVWNLFFRAQDGESPCLSATWNFCLAKIALAVRTKWAWLGRAIMICCKFYNVEIEGQITLKILYTFVRNPKNLQKPINEKLSWRYHKSLLNFRTPKENPTDLQRSKKIPEISPNKWCKFSKNLSTIRSKSQKSW